VAEVANIRRHDFILDIFTMPFIPLIAAVLYLLGGQVNKWFRWGMGISIAGMAFYHHHSLWVLLAIPAYFAATNFFSYGEKMIWTKLFGGWVSMGIAGLAMGLASITVLGWFWGVIQGIVGMVAFLVVKYYDDKGVIHNPVVELSRGFFGTILFFCF
jgi:hypothetical protein